MDDNKNDDNMILEDDITYEKYKIMLELRKEQMIKEIVENKNFSIQEKLIIAFERELNQLKLEQKNLIYSNEQMLKLLPDDKLSIESREINLLIYQNNQKKIKELESKITNLKMNLEIENNTKKEEEKNKTNNNNEFVKEIEL